ncbi:MAG: hypothetical protein BWY76_00574 [bacterium ADurb.Bin429]|nr:MAG: hypothetical protein BWY76_00574 [bacterium ADurb.Bin429]
MSLPWRLLYDLTAVKTLRRLPDPVRERTELRIASILLDLYDPGVTMAPSPYGMIGSLWTVDRIFIVYVAITRHARWNQPVILIANLITEDEFLDSLLG